MNPSVSSPISFWFQLPTAPHKIKRLDLNPTDGRDFGQDLPLTGALPKAQVSVRVLTWWPSSLGGTG